MKENTIHLLVLKYIPAVNDYSGAYDTEGSGSISKNQIIRNTAFQGFDEPYRKRIG